MVWILPKLCYQKGTRVQRCWSWVPAKHSWTHVQWIAPSELKFHETWLKNQWASSTSLPNEHSKQAAYILGSSSILQLKVWPVRQLLTFCPATCLRLAKDLLKNKLLDIQLLKNLPNLWCYWIKPLKYLSTYRTSRLPRCTDPDQKWTLAPDLDFKKKVLSFPFSSPFNLFSFLPFSKCGTAKIPVARS